MRRFKQLYSRHQRNRDLISVGAYVAGTDPLLDQAIALVSAHGGFLTQDMDARVPARRRARDSRRCSRSPATPAGPVTRATPPWDRLKDLAAKRRDAEAQRLSAAVRTRVDAREAPGDARLYRADYLDRLRRRRAAASAPTAAQLPRVPRAPRSRDPAAGGPDRRRRPQRQGVREQWHAERVRVESFQALEGRHAETRERVEERHAQKLTDEWAARASTLTARTDNNDH